MNPNLPRLALISVLTCTNFANAAEPEAPKSLEEALSKGKFSLNVRLRVEQVDVKPLEADAVTVRTRFGYKTAPYNGFTAYIEGQNNTALQDDYREPGTPVNGYAIIADPEATQISQAWLGYTSKEYATTVIAGRQRIVYDNARFIGDVAWRNNLLTYESVTLKNTSVAKLEFNYAYIWDVKRIFANPPDPAFRDFDAESHLLNLSYAGLPIGKLTGYAYLLEFRNGLASSSASYGLSLVGSQAAGASGVTVGYRAEYASQSDYADNPASYDADYYVGELNLGYQGFNLQLGYNVLGSDDGVAAFQTPLATGHAFNGWADIFLNTPINGLKAGYVGLTLPIPGGVVATIRYFDFKADNGNLKYGDEYDFQLTYKINKEFSLLGKVAMYKARDFGIDTERYIAQLEYNF